MRVLIIRTDRLGDCILASPTWQALREARPDAEITYLTRRAFVPLFENDPLLKSVMPFPESGRGGIDELALRLSGERLDALLALYVDRQVARLVRRTAAAVKAGPLSKPRSWFLFNRPVRQRRSASLMHEADYNGGLLRTLAIPYQPRPPRIHLSSRQRAMEGSLFQRLLGERSSSPFFIVHPGMGGSAGNWPPAHYRSLVEELLETATATVVLTGTPADGGFLGEIPRIRHPRFVSTIGMLSLEELALLINGAAVFVGPSTGPMHLATALGVPVVTIYSPLRVQHPRRWGPYHAKGTVLVPLVECPEKHRCRGDRCPHHDCLDLITVGDVIEGIRQWAPPESWDGGGGQNSL